MLDETQESDLIGLVSGFGTPESDDRARALIRNNQQAAHYVQEMLFLGKALEPPGEREAVVLDPGAMDRVAAGAAGRLRSRRWRRRMAPLGIAAAMALILFGIHRFRGGDGEQPFAFAETVAQGPFVGVPPVYRHELRPNLPFDVKLNEVALVRTRSGAVVALNEGARVVLTEDLINLQSGSLFIIAAPMGTRLRAGPMEGTQREGRALVTVTDRSVEWGVRKGNAVTRVGQELTLLNSGQRILWSIPEQKIELGSTLPEQPPWVKLALELDLTIER